MEEERKYTFKIYFKKSGKGELLLFCWKTVKTVVTEMVLSMQT